MRERILLDCAESELDLWLRSWKVADVEKLLPSNAAPYMDGEPMKRDSTTKLIDRDPLAGDGDYPILLNYDPPGLAENQTIGKTTTIDGGTFYAWIHPDCFDEDTEAPSAGDRLMCGPIAYSGGAPKPFNGFKILSALTGSYYDVGQFEYVETRFGVDYLYCRLQLPGTMVYVP